MILISHRGNINGINPKLENNPYYIDDTIKFGFDVEVDLWKTDIGLFLGHDALTYEIKLDWLMDRTDKLWVHCKNIECINFLQEIEKIHFFWHQEDTVTLTSKNYIWAYPGKQPIRNSIAVCPEIHNDNLDYVLGICSDYIFKYK